MLKTNSKKAIENIREYIIDNFDPCGYDIWNITDIPENADFKTIAQFIYNCFVDEKVRFDNRRMTEKALFFEWCSGLPSILDTCYYYNRSAIDDLSKILEETEKEKKRFTEAQAEERLTYLIYREIKKVVK